MPYTHLEVCPNDRKNLVIHQNHRSWKAGLVREHAARTRQAKACRPVAPEFPPALKNLPELSRSRPSSGLDGAEDQKKLDEAYNRMHRTWSGHSLPTHWAGQDLNQNPRLAKQLSEASFLSMEPKEEKPIAMVSPVGSSSPMGAFRGGGIRTERAGSFDSGRFSSQFGSSSTFGGRPGTGALTVPGLVALPAHMVAHPPTGQWMI